MIRLQLILLLVIAAEPQSVTMQEFFQRECDKGDQLACQKLESLSADLVIQKRLTERSEKFWDDIDTSKLMLDKKKPNLQAAYPLVVKDFIATQNQAGIDEVVDEERLPECALHYHDYWINKKLWWPENEEGMPDWTAIYLYIVDHYYGYCLRQQ